MNGLLDRLVVLCGPTLGADGLWLLPGLLLAGLAGSVVHCGAMCGPFVLGQAADRLARLPPARMCEAARLRGAMLLPYHAGRLGTYAALGAIGGWLGGAGLPRAVPAVLLAGAAIAFLLLAVQRLQPALAPVTGPARGGAWLGTAVVRLAGRQRGNGFALGLALGLLPCGLLYAAVAAAASGGPVLGALGMLAFGLGTVPALVAVALVGHALGRRWQRGVAGAAPYLLGANAALLMLLAWRAATGG